VTSAALHDRLDEPAEDLLWLFLKEGASASELPPEIQLSRAMVMDIVSWFAYRFLEPVHTNEQPPSRAKMKRLEWLLDTIRQNQQTPVPVRSLQQAVMEVGALVPYDYSPAASALGTLLRHGDFRLRVNVCQSLGRVGGEVASQRLQEALNDGNGAVQRTAAVALYLHTAGELARKLKTVYLKHRLSGPLSRLEDSGDHTSAPPVSSPALAEPPVLARVENGSDVEPKVAEDRNIAAFEAQAEQLLGQYAGEFLVFCDGDFVGHSAHLQEAKMLAGRVARGKEVMIVEPECRSGQTGK